MARPSGVGFENTLPSPEYGWDPDDALSDEERAEIKAMFKPAVVRPYSERRFIPPEQEPWTKGEVAMAALGAALIGVGVGWIWRRVREEKAAEKRVNGYLVGIEAKIEEVKSAQLRGVDVIVSLK